MSLFQCERALRACLLESHAAFHTTSSLPVLDRPATSDSRTCSRVIVDEDIMITRASNSNQASTTKIRQSRTLVISHEWLLQHTNNSTSAPCVKTFIPSDALLNALRVRPRLAHAIRISKGSRRQQKALFPILTPTPIQN